MNKEEIEKNRVNYIKQLVHEGKISAQDAEKDFGVVVRVNSDRDPYAAGFYEDSKPKYYELCDFIKNTYHIKSNDSFVYQYMDNYYQLMAKSEFKKLVMDLTKQQAKPHELDYFYQMARSYCFTKDDDFQEPDGFLNLNNGVLHVQTGNLLPHDPKYFFKYKLPHKYDPTAECPRWLEFLNFVFEGDKELVDLSAEIFGYAMSGGRPWLHKAFLLFGEGRNGKSTYIDVLKFMLGSKNVSSVPIENLNKPFSVVMADGKLANIIGETSSNEIDSQAFKTAVSGEDLIASHKGLPEYKMAFNAKIFFAANKLPYFKDTTTGAYEKLCIIPFNRYIKPDERIPNIAENLLFPEISGIINWALNGYQRLVARRHLPEVKSVSENLETYRKESDGVYDWVSKFFIITKDCEDEFLIKDYYPHYQALCKAQMRHCMSLIGFSRKVSHELKKNSGVIITSSREGAKVMRGVEKPSNLEFLNTYKF